MFATRNIAEIRLETPSVAMDSADTTIQVNNGGGGVPPRPEFRASTRPVETTERIANRTYTHNTVTTPGGTTTSTHRQVNWGGVVKGAAIVTGVVLAGVVAFSVAPAVLTSLGLIGEGGLLTGVINTVAPAVAWAGDMLLSGALFALHFVESAAVALWTTLGFGTIGGGAAAATTVSTGAISTATGALAAGGTLAVGVPIAAKAVMATPMMDTVHTTSVTAPMLTGMEDGGVAAQHSANHAQAAAAHGQQQATATHGHGHGHGHGNSADMMDMPDLHEEMSQLKNSSKMAHHAAHDVEAHREHGESAESRSRSALRSSTRTSQAWADRVGAPAERKAAIAPRHSDFAAQVAEDRAHLDAALQER